MILESKYYNSLPWL